MDAQLVAENDAQGRRQPLRVERLVLDDENVARESELGACSDKLALLGQMAASTCRKVRRHANSNPLKRNRLGERKSVCRTEVHSYDLRQASRKRLEKRDCNIAAQRAICFGQRMVKVAPRCRGASDCSLIVP